MSYRRDREQFVASMARIKVSLGVTLRLLKEATTLNRIAELQCSSEAADKDQVPCPKRYQTADGCLCRDYGSWDEQDIGTRAMNHHASVPRVNVQEAHAERRVREAIASAGVILEVEFQGDPRGWPMSVRLVRFAGDNSPWIGVPNGPSGIRW